MKLLSNARAQWLAVNIVPHERAIRSWLAKRTHDLDIDDIVQEMYARLAALDDAEKIINPRQYASRTAISIALNLVRHARVVPMIAIGEFEGLELASLEPSAEKIVSSREELRQLENTLAELPDACRTAFLLRRVEGLSQKEVAEKLGVSIKAVEKYMARSIRLLIEVYGGGGAGSARVSKDDREKVRRRKKSDEIR